MYQINSPSSESCPKAKSEIFFLASLQNKFLNQQNTSPGTFVEIKPWYKKPLFLSPDTQSEHSINQIAWFTTVPSENYSIPDKLSQNVTLASAYIATEEQRLELSVVQKFKKINQVKKIYINYSQELTTVKIILDTDFYNYDLMEKILNEAEVPIRNIFLERLVDFEYIPIYPKTNHLVNTQADKLIFNKKTHEVPPTRQLINSAEFEDYLFPKKHSFAFQYVHS